MSRSIIKKQLFVRNSSSGGSLSSPVGVSDGGTGLTSYAVGDLIYASGVTTLSKLAGVAAGQLLLSGGVATAPVYSGTNFTFDKIANDLVVGDATKAQLNVSGTNEIAYINSTNGFAVNNITGESWLSVSPSAGVVDIGDIDAGGNGSKLVIDDGLQVLEWNKSAVTINSVAYTFPAANASGVLTNNGSGVLSWATTSSGITINSTAITSGGANRILFENSSNQVSESAKDFYFQSSSPYAHVFASGRSGTITGVNNSVFSYNAAYSLTSGTNNCAFGFNALYGVSTASYNTAFGASALENSTGASNTAVGYYSQGVASGAGGENTSIGFQSLRGRTSGTRNFAGGAEALYTNQTGSYNIGIGFQSNYTGNGLTGSIGIGYFANPTASNQGVLGSGEPEGYVGEWYFNGVTDTSPYSVVLNACGGSGSNVAGASMTDAGGKGTGSGTPGIWCVKTSTTLGSGTTLQSLVSRLAISGGAVTTDASTATWAEALDFVFGTTTGTKIGTSTSQKIGFWNATPVVQQVLATGAAATVDDVITLLQTLGLCKQS